MQVAWLGEPASLDATTGDDPGRLRHIDLEIARHLRYSDDDHRRVERHEQIAEPSTVHAPMLGRQEIAEPVD